SDGGGAGLPWLQLRCGKWAVDLRWGQEYTSSYSAWCALWERWARMQGRWGCRQVWLLRLWQGGGAVLVMAALLLWSLTTGPREAESPQLVMQPDQGVGPLVRYIEGARTSLDGEIYLLTSPDVLSALETAPARGIRVRLLLEHYPFGGGGPRP